MEHYVEENLNTKFGNYPARINMKIQQKRRNVVKTAIECWIIHKIFDNIFELKENATNF